MERMFARKRGKYQVFPDEDQAQGRTEHDQRYKLPHIISSIF
ncbi:hypothetical protein HanXRQr2_Chr09g0392161 [Helianthus annuus]|uniref:Uncharacterized protein n=1 Tax=Helianthus annuus TaxID=4232 RepID=A0A9K3I6Y6_HELAN|nr:hypothetical protein HanXRQr2_Chr09g0392161 [Helianthus annuus]